ncbi:hypothetical protein MTO96_048332 [Rhipicephalus appendiculatus]
MGVFLEPMTFTNLKVEMTCEGCSGAVQRVLGKLEGQGVNKTCSYVGVKK